MPILSSFGGLAAIGRGQRSGGPFVKTISTNQQELNLATWALANGWDGSAYAEITVGSGVYVWSDNTATPALATGSFPAGLKIINNGYIMGRGGNGGGGSVGSNTYIAAQAGGDAISLGTSCSIDNTNGYIGGGGGGGGGSVYSFTVALSGGGGAGGGAGGRCYVSGDYGQGGAGGAIGSSGGTTAYPYATGGGGGRVFPSSRTTPANNTLNGPGGSGGGAGGCTTPNAATGGYGGAAGEAGGNGVLLSNPSGGMGGGGGWGSAGGAANNNYSGYTNYPGAAGGKSVALNGYSVTWINSTKVYGAQA